MNSLMDHAASAFSSWGGVFTTVVAVAYYLGCFAIIMDKLWDDTLDWLIANVAPANAATRLTVAVTSFVLLACVAFAFMFMLPMFALIAFFVKLCERLWEFVTNV